MNINGWLKNSFVDYPGKIATTVFVSGCNFLCPYCHNADLVLNQNLENYNEEEIFNFLIKRKGMIDAICVSGGEPTIYADLPDFLKKIRDLDIDVLIKLDTNGTNPTMLKEVIDKNLVDYVAMDIKAPLLKYPKACGNGSVNLNSIKESVEILKENKINKKLDCEFRTTIVRELLTQTDLVEISKWIGSDIPYYLQQYKKSEKQIENKEFGTYSKEDLEEIAKVLKKTIKKVDIRNV